FRLELQELSALLTVLATVARSGAMIESVHASGPFAILGLWVPPHAAHRIKPRLEQLVEVLAVGEIRRWPRWIFGRCSDAGRNYVNGPPHLCGGHPRPGPPGPLGGRARGRGQPRRRGA